jgi:hypothetical protein
MEPFDLFTQADIKLDPAASTGGEDKYPRTKAKNSKLPIIKTLFIVLMISFREDTFWVEQLFFRVDFYIS